MKVFNINDTYFKYQKCLSGITYQFVNQLDNIYDKNLMVGTNYCVYCMYNEFDIINNFMINLYQVDICSTMNLDLTKRYTQIDGTNLRTGHRVLLVSQIDKTQNDIYQVDSRGYLLLTDELTDTGRTWRYKSYVKLGSNKGKQFHLKNTGNRFPLTGERKDFLDGHGYIIKSFFNYDLFDTGPIVPKLIFSDYELARISVNRNYNLYNGFQFYGGNTFDIQYHGNSYLVSLNNDPNNYIYTGITSGTTIFNDFSTDVYGDYGYETFIETDTNICSQANVYDYIKLEISGSTNLYLKSFIKRIEDPYIIISDYIADNILNDYYTGTTSSYTFTNLMYTDTSNFKNTILDSYFSKYFDIDDNDYLYPLENPDNLYFDYDGLKFISSGNTTYINEFTTNNHYIRYNLYSQLNEINSYLFNSGYSFLIDKSFTGFTAEYFDERPNPYIYPSTNLDVKGTHVKITPDILSFVNYFKKNTFINISTNTGKYKTLIVDLVPNEYFVIETYKSNSGLTIENYALETIYNLKDISDILYDVYINDVTPTNSDYYRLRDDDMRRNICNAYADFISQDIGIISNVTAFLMQDAHHKFILKVYDPENAFNGGVIRPPYVVTSLPVPPTTWTSTSAQLYGEVINDGGSNIVDRGICFSKSSVTQNNCTGATFWYDPIGPFYSNITNLDPLNIYYYRAYARNYQGGISYGNVYSFTCGSPNYGPPSVTTKNASVLTSYSFNLNGEVTYIGWTPITLRGFIYIVGNIDPYPSGDIVTFSPEPGTIGNFGNLVTGVSYNTQYSYRAFATNVCGTTYGEIGLTMTPNPIAPLVTTVGWNNKTYQSFDALSSLDNQDLYYPATTIGICYSDTNPVPTIVDTVLTYSPIAIGPYTVSITSLNPSTTYYFRAFASNGIYFGPTTSYGIVMNTITNPIPVAPTVNIDQIVSYGQTVADISNMIVSDGGDAIISKGLYYDTVSPPVANLIPATGGTIYWRSYLTGLSTSTLYYIQATATNAFGTGVSTILSFTTQVACTPSTDPTSISGTANFCPAVSTTLNVVGGSLGTGAAWYWYKGSCGGTSVGTGTSLIVNNALGGGTYYVRAEGTCGTTNCVSLVVTEYTESTVPTSISGNNYFCTAGTTILTVNGGSLGTGAVWTWYRGSCGGTLMGTGPSLAGVNIADTYYVRAEGTCNNTSCASLIVTSATPSIAPTSITGDLEICPGGSTKLIVADGSLGTGAQWQWFRGSCGGFIVATGVDNITVTEANTYYVRAQGLCNTTDCASVTVTVNILSVAPSSISGNNYICPGGDTTLTVNGGSLGTGADWYWYEGSCSGTLQGTGPSITVTLPGNYYVRAEGTCNATSCATINIVAYTNSTPATSITSFFTSVSSKTLTEIGGSLGTGAQWFWYKGGCGTSGGGTFVGNGTSYTATSSGTYYVRAEGTCNITTCVWKTITI